MIIYPGLAYDDEAIVFLLNSVHCFIESPELVLQGCALGFQGSSTETLVLKNEDSVWRTGDFCIPWYAFIHPYTVLSDSTHIPLHLLYPVSLFIYFLATKL